MGVSHLVWQLFTIFISLAQLIWFIVIFVVILRLNHEKNRPFNNKLPRPQGTKEAQKGHASPNTPHIHINHKNKNENKKLGDNEKVTLSRIYTISQTKTKGTLYEEIITLFPKDLTNHLNPSYQSSNLNNNNTIDKVKGDGYVIDNDEYHNNVDDPNESSSCSLIEGEASAHSISLSVMSNQTHTAPHTNNHSPIDHPTLIPPPVSVPVPVPVSVPLPLDSEFEGFRPVPNNQVLGYKSDSIIPHLDSSKCITTFANHRNNNDYLEMDNQQAYLRVQTEMNKEQDELNNNNQIKSRNSYHNNLLSNKNENRTEVQAGSAPGKLSSEGKSLTNRYGPYGSSTGPGPGPSPGDKHKLVKQADGYVNGDGAFPFPSQTQPIKGSKAEAEVEVDIGIGGEMEGEVVDGLEGSGGAAGNLRRSASASRLQINEIIAVMKAATQGQRRPRGYSLIQNHHINSVISKSHNTSPLKALRINEVNPLNNIITNQSPVIIINNNDTGLPQLKTQTQSQLLLSTTTPILIATNASDIQTNITSNSSVNSNKNNFHDNSEFISSDQVVKFDNSNHHHVDPNNNFDNVKNKQNLEAPKATLRSSPLSSVHSEGPGPHRSDRPGSGRTGTSGLAAPLNVRFEVDLPSPLNYDANSRRDAPANNSNFVSPPRPIRSIRGSQVVVNANVQKTNDAITDPNGTNLNEMGAALHVSPSNVREFRPSILRAGVVNISGPLVFPIYYNFLKALTVLCVLWFAVSVWQAAIGEDLFDWSNGSHRSIPLLIFSSCVLSITAAIEDGATLFLAQKTPDRIALKRSFYFALVWACIECIMQISLQATDRNNSSDVQLTWHNPFIVRSILKLAFGTCMLSLPSRIYCCIRPFRYHEEDVRPNQRLRDAWKFLAIYDISMAAITLGSSMCNWFFPSDVFVWMALISIAVNFFIYTPFLFGILERDSRHWTECWHSTIHEINASSFPITLPSSTSLSNVNTHTNIAGSLSLSQSSLEASSLSEPLLAHPSFYHPLHDVIIFMNELEFVRAIGSGGFSSVYECRLWGQFDVAVKLLHVKELTPRVIDTFLHEIAMLVQLRHPNVVTFIASALSPPDLAIITELCLRRSLLDLIKQRRVLFTEFASVCIAIAIADALRYIHSHDVIHRDLKSANILFDEHGRPKLCDFGLSSHQQQIHHVFAGTLAYMSPEVLRSETVVKASDVYSFSIILWEMLHNELAWRNSRKQVHPRALMMMVSRKHERPRLLSRYINGPSSILVPPSVVSKEGVHPLLASLLMDMWHPDFNLRPSFDEIIPRLEKVRDILIQAAQDQRKESKLQESFSTTQRS